ncbi:MAG: acyl-CoA dehydrogenase family protein [Phycisphaerae bacterium]
MPLVACDCIPDPDAAVLVDGARAYARQELLPRDPAWDTEHGSVIDVLPTLAEMGFLNLCIPPELGGLGCAFSTYASIIHELSYASPSVAVTVAVHSMVGRILNEFAAEPLRTAVLSKWGEPADLAAFAISEANAGSDPGASRTEAAPVDGGLRITGEKMWITNGLSARWFLTLVRLSGTNARDGLCAVLIDGHDTGIERTPIRGKMGIRGSETAVIHYENVFVPDDRIIGRDGDGLNVCLSALNQGRIGIAAQASGIAEACVDEMVSYARQREQFGQPIGRFQAVAEMIADSATELAAAKALTWRAARMVDARRRTAAASSMAKLYASEAANRIAYRAVQVHGGAGYVHECRVEQLYRDARVTPIYEGTSEIQRLVIARELAAAD